jgi:hypothetical protein
MNTPVDAHASTRAAPNLLAATCARFGIREQEFQRYLFRRTVFRRAQLIGWLIHPFHPDFLYQERRLIAQVAHAVNLAEVRNEIDFYQHKYVVGSVRREIFSMRLSGQRLLRIAKMAYDGKA